MLLLNLSKRELEYLIKREYYLIAAISVIALVALAKRNVIVIINKGTINSELQHPHKFKN